MSALGAAARRLVEAGAFVHPIRPRAKLPLTAHGCSDASRDVEQVDAWWSRWPDANVAIATGPSGLLVIDLDGEEGLAAWRTLLADHPAATPRTLYARTGRGLHLYYKAPTGRRLGNTAGKLASNIDTRGVGGFVLAPPSVHPSGSVYRWYGGQLAELAELPDWIAELLDPPRPPRAPVTPGAAAVNGGIGHLSRWLAAQPVGRRNAGLHWAACRAVAEGFDPELLAPVAVATGLSPGEVRATIASASKTVAATQ